MTKKNNEVSFVLENGEYLSVQQLLQYAESGYHVMRTGHIGNQYPSNLLLLEAGIEALLFDKNSMSLDKNFWPAYVIADGKRIPIAEEKTILSPFAQFVDLAEEVTPFVNGSKNPAQLHTDSLQKLFGSRVSLESSFLVEQSDLFFRLAENLYRIDSDLFSRVVSDDGTVKSLKFSKYTKANPQDIGQSAVDTNFALLALLNSQNFPFQGGRLPRIEATLLMSTILAAVKTSRDVVFELSGPDLIKYALKNKFKERMNHLYQKLKLLMPDLPDQLKLIIVPTFNFRFGSLQSEKNTIDELWLNLQEFISLNSEKRSAINSVKKKNKDNLKDRGVQERLKQIGLSYQDKLSDLAAKIVTSPVYSQIDFSLSEGNYFSQYDLLLSGESLYIPEEVLSMSMMDLEKIYSTFQKLSSYIN